MRLRNATVEVILETKDVKFHTGFQKSDIPIHFYL